MYSKNIFYITLIISLFYACKPETKNPGDPFENYDRKQLLNNIGNNIIIPSIENLKNATTNFEILVDSFILNSSISNLQALQNQWLTTTQNWKEIEFCKMSLMNDMNTLAALDYGSAYPLSIQDPVDESLVESVIANNISFTPSLIQTLPGNQKGLWTLEYLLFDNSKPIDSIYSQFNLNNNRKFFLRALTTDIKTITNNWLNDWSTNGANYVNSFIQNDSRDVNSSISMLVNDMIFLIEVIKNEKVGRPLGKRTNAVIQPNSCEALRSAYSTKFLKYNLKGCQNLFLGNSQLGDLTGFDNLLEYLNAQYGSSTLTNAIKNQFLVVNQKIDAITSPLSEMVVTNALPVNELYTELVKLVALLKVDMASQIGVVITYTDNDGD